MQGIINWQKLIDVSGDDYTDEQGFFFRCTGAGNIKYTLKENADAEAVTGAFDATPDFKSPMYAKKIFANGTTATGIYVGKSL